MVKVKAEAVPFYRFQLPLQRKFAASNASSFRFHIPDANRFLRYKLYF